MNIGDKEFMFFSKIVTDDHVVEVKIRSFSDLADGWHFGEGGPISEKVISVALALSKYARELNFSEIDAFPGVNGEILLTLYYGDYVLELTVESDLSINVVMEVGDEEVFDKEGLSILEAKEQVHKLREK
jgi:hypothetical protein